MSNKRKIKRNMKKRARAIVTKSPRAFVTHGLAPHLPPGRLVIVRKDTQTGEYVVLFPRAANGERLLPGRDTEPALTVKQAQDALMEAGVSHEYRDGVSMKVRPSHATVLNWIRRKLLPGAVKDPLSLGRGGAWYIPQSAISKFRPPKKGAPFKKPQAGGDSPRGDKED